MKSPFTIRPFQLGLLIFFGLAALVGLYLFASYNGAANKANQIGAVVIWGTLPQTAVENELSAIEETQKQFAKVTYVQKPAATFDENLSDAIAAGDGPDLVIIDQEQLMDEQNKLNIIPFSALPQRVFDDTYLPEDQMYISSTGVYGIPYVLDPLVLYYNQTLLTSGGIAVIPSTWEAIAGMAPTLTRINSNQTIAQSTIAFGTYDNVDNSRAIVSMLLLQSGTSITQASAAGVRSVLAASSATSDTEPSVSAMNFYTQFADPSRTVYTWNESGEDSRQVFLSGNLAYYVGFASELPLLKSANPNLDFDMAQIPQPQTASTKADYGLAYAFAIPKASHDPNGALATAKALATASYVNGAAAALSMAPSQRALLVSNPADPYSPVYYPMALISQGWLSPAPATTDAIFSAMITNINSGRMDSPTAIDTAAQALTAALGQ